MYENMNEILLYICQNTNNCNVCDILLPHTCQKHIWTDFGLLAITERIMVLKGQCCTVFSSREYCASERSDFRPIYVVGGVIILKWPILDYHHIERICHFGKTYFGPFSQLKGVMVFEGLILGCLLFGRVWWSCKDSFLYSFYFRRVKQSWKEWFWTTIN